MGEVTSPVGGAFGAGLGADVASAATLNLDAQSASIVDVTGTTGITAITLGAGRVRIVRFTGALILTHGASLVLPGAANITTVAGDYAIFVGYASGVVRCMAYARNAVPYESGSFAVAATGFSSFTAASNAFYARVGNRVTLRLPQIDGTSNATTFTLTGLPASLRPTIASGFRVCMIRDNGTDAYGYLTIATNGTVTLTPSAAGSPTSWTASGTKRLYDMEITYLLA